MKEIEFVYFITDLQRIDADLDELYPTIELDIDDTRAHKIFKALEMICDEFDLSNPIWLESNIKEFKKIARTRFYADSFVESIDFDYLDFYVIEED